MTKWCFWNNFCICIICIFFLWCMDIIILILNLLSNFLPCSLNFTFFRLLQRKEKLLLDSLWKGLVRIRQMHSQWWKFMKIEIVLEVISWRCWILLCDDIHIFHQANGSTPEASNALSGELWEVKKERIREASVHGKLPGWDLRSVSTNLLLSLSLLSLSLVFVCFQAQCTSINHVFGSGSLIYACKGVPYSKKKGSCDMLFWVCITNLKSHQDSEGKVSSMNKISGKVEGNWKFNDYPCLTRMSLRWNMILTNYTVLKFVFWFFWSSWLRQNYYCLFGFFSGMLILFNTKLFEFKMI